MGVLEQESYLSYIKKRRWKRYCKLHTYFRLDLAFGRVDWDFVSSDLQKFEYGEKFIRMIKVAYTDIQSKIKINAGH